MIKILNTSGFAVSESLPVEKSLDVTCCANNGAICAEITALSRPNLALRVKLIGSIETPLCVESIVNHCRDQFCHLEVVDHTSLLSSAYLQALAQENTVRGNIARRLIEMDAATDDTEEKRVLELALRELLQRFNAMQGSWL